MVEPDDPDRFTGLMTKGRGMVASQLVEALTSFIAVHGDLHILTADWDIVGDVDIMVDTDVVWCYLCYKDIDRIPITPYAFQKEEE